MAVTEGTNTYNNRALRKSQVKTLFTHAVVGPVTSGTANGVIQRVTQSNIDTFGPGISIELIRFMLNSGAQFVDFYPSTVGTGNYAAKLGTLTKVGTGLVDPVLAGAALDSYLVKIKIVNGGTNTTATYQFSFDDGQSWSGTQTAALAATALPLQTGVNSGLTLAFPAGSYVAGDLFYAAAHPAAVDVTSLPTAFAALLTRGSYNVVAIAGTGQSGSTDALNLGITSSYVGACNTALALWKAARSPAQFFVAAPRQNDLGVETTLAAALAANVTNTSDGCCVGFGHILRGTGYKNSAWRSAQWLVLERLIQINSPVMHSIYNVTDGALVIQTPSPQTYTGVSLGYNNNVIERGVTYDEQQDAANSPTLLGFICVQSPRERPGQYYFTQGNNHSDLTSDFFEMAYWLGATIFVPMINQIAYSEYKGASILTNSDGTIEEGQATQIENFINGQVSASLVQSGIIPPAPDGGRFFELTRSYNYQATGRLTGTIGFWVPTYVKYLSFAFSLKL